MIDFDDYFLVYTSHFRGDPYIICIKIDSALTPCQLQLFLYKNDYL